MKSKLCKILGIGLATGLVIGLIGAVFAAPVSADMMKWGIVNTPSWDDMVILPDSNILDYDIGGDGDIIYAVLEIDPDCTGVGEDTNGSGFALVKSEDGGVTWSDLTDNVDGAASIPVDFRDLIAVAVAPDDEDWLAVVGRPNAPDIPMVVASKDGGSNFTYAGRMEDTDESTEMQYVYDLDVSIEVDGIHNIAVAGMTGAAGDGGGQGSIFRLKAGTWLTGSWEDTAAEYDGWDDGIGGGLFTEGVVACAFSPNFDMDDTIVFMGVAADGSVNGIPYLQSGIWEGGGGTYNAEAGFPNAIEIKSNGDTLWTGVYLRSMGLALPDDYDGSDPGARAMFVYVDAYNVTSGLVGGCVFRIDNNALSPVCGPSGEPLLSSIDVHGDADTGKLMIGEYVEWDNDVSGPWGGPGGNAGNYNHPDCCAGVSVWHTEELDFCCPQWDGACKDPSGPALALVMYTPDGEKAYATTSGKLDGEFFGSAHSVLDESAFSVSLDDGLSFNQLGLIDTHINMLSDVAVCPDCSVVYLSSINNGDLECLGSEDPRCTCDSVWRSYDNGDTWERIYHGSWSPNHSRDLLLRLPCDAIEDCCDQDPVAPSGTIYLGIEGSDDLFFYSRDCGQCWNKTPALKFDLRDFAVESENIVYVLNTEGQVSKSTQYGRRWSDPVDTDIGCAWDIEVCCEQGLILVAPGYSPGPTGCSQTDKVAWSDDGGESWNLTDAIPGDLNTSAVACDPVCEDIVYAVTAPQGGIFRIDLTDGSVTKISILSLDYTGIAMAREGTLYAAFDDICDAGTSDVCDPDRFSEDCGTSGVARNLGPCETDCCGAETWDYLVCGIDADDDDGDFDINPNSIRICGCLSIDTNSIIWAIDRDDYVVDPNSGDYRDGALWSYEDCAAKVAPTLTAPADGAVLDCEPCLGCDAANFTLKWERMCEACSYDIEIMDSTGNVVVKWVDKDITGDPPSLFVNGTAEYDSTSVDFTLECGMNYTWHVREANTSCECVHSPWSDSWSFTVAVGAADAIQLLAPKKGAMGTPIENIGFSWTAVRNATSYSFVLSPNADLTGALASQDLSTTAFNYAGPLDYSMAYYWQVIAWEDGTRLTTSAVGVFNTMAEPEEAPPPVVVEEQPAPVINIPPAEQITPIWIYAVIGVGAALTVLVIVLIVRSRRP